MMYQFRYQLFSSPFCTSHHQAVPVHVLIITMNLNYLGLCHYWNCVLDTPGIEILLFRLVSSVQILFRLVDTAGLRHGSRNRTLSSAAEVGEVPVAAVHAGGATRSFEEKILRTIGDAKQAS